MSQSGHEQWIRIFDVPESKLHQDGYTVYKIISTLLHRSFPEASTSLEVWRRYSDILKLHKEIIKLYHYLKLPENPPPYTKPSIVKRFDGEVIESRRKCTLALLNYCAKYPSIYASEQFTMFFKEEYTIRKKKLSFGRQKDKKSTSSLAASLGIPDGSTEYSLYPKLNENTSSSEDLSGKAGAGTGSVYVGNSVSLRISDDRENSSCPIKGEDKRHYSEENMSTTDACLEPLPGLKVAQKSDSQISVVQNVESSSRCYSVDYNSHKTSPAKSESLNYLTVNAAKGKKKDVRRTNPSGYLQRAEKLISKLSLRDGRRSQNDSQPDSESVKLLRHPSCDLNNYRVVGTSGNIIVAIDLTTQETVAIKVIEKGSSKDEKEPLLPRSVPFMVPIFWYHETEFAFYLILKYISGGKLWNHLKKFIKQPVSDSSRRESAIKTSSTYEGQRLIEKVEEPPVISTKEENEPSLLEYYDLSDKDPRSFSFGSNHAVPECMSSAERNLSSRYLDAVHLQSSLSNIVDIRPQELEVRQREHRGRSTPQGKSKSLDELNSSRGCSNRGISPKRINGERDELQGKLERGKFKLYKDNESIGSDTLSGVSEDFSCSSLNPVSDTENQDMEKVSTITSYSWPKAMAENSTFDIISLIENSKKLIEDVNKTLARSKKQILETFATPKDNVSSEKVNISCHVEGENQNTADTDVDNADPASVYLSARSTSAYEKNVGQELSLPRIDPICFRDQEGASAIPKDLTPLPEWHNTGSSPAQSSSNNDSSVPFLFEDTQHSSLLSEEGHPVPEGLVRVWASQVITAFNHIHSQNIIWGDFNPSNLLLDEGGSILVTYNYSTSDHRFYSGHTYGGIEADWVVCQGYKAPELASPVFTATDAADWWSVGALLFHLLTGKDVASCFPCGFTSHTQLYFPSSVSEEADSLISKLLCAQPLERLGSGCKGVQEIKDHPFFYGIEWPYQL